MNRGVAEDVFVLDVGELLPRRFAEAAGGRGSTVDAARGRVVSFAGGERPLSFEAVAVVRWRFELSIPIAIADHRRRDAVTISIAVTIAIDGNPLMVDGAGVALGPVASQPLPNRIAWLTLRPLPYRFALADVADRLAIGGAFLAIGLARRAFAIGWLGGRGLSGSGPRVGLRRRRAGRLVGDRRGGWGA
jgi:hypothetical protein